VFDVFKILQCRAGSDQVAIIEGDREFSYGDLVCAIDRYYVDFSDKDISSGLVLFFGDFTFQSIAMFFSLLKLKNTIMLCNDVNKTEFYERIDNADYIINAITNSIQKIKAEQKKSIVQKLNDENKAGLIFLSSGTTGKPKAILHNFERLIQKYQYSKRKYRTLAFLLFDHIAGFDTMMYTLSAGGSLVCINSRATLDVVKIISDKTVEVLPTSPSYINLMLLERTFNPKRLSSLKIITFGSERIPEITLLRLKVLFGDNVQILQKYGITELGNPNVVCCIDDPAWIKFKDNGLEYKIVDDVLHIKTKSSMIGYIDESGYEEFDGWYDTQDKVEVDGEWMRILGRVTDIINVGGQKVYPTEVESVLLHMDNIVDVVVSGKNNPLMGSVVSASITLSKPESIVDLKNRIRKFCTGKIEPFKIPASIEIVKNEQFNHRYKKERK